MNELATKAGQAGEPVTVELGGRQNAFDFRLQGGRNAFIGIEREHPVRARKRNTTLLLGPVAGPIGLHDLGAGGLRDGDGGVRAAGVEYDDLIGECGALNAFFNMMGFVFCNDDDAQGAHGLVG